MEAPVVPTPVALPQTAQVDICPSTSYSSSSWQTVETVETVLLPIQSPPPPDHEGDRDHGHEDDHEDEQNRQYDSSPAVPTNTALPSELEELTYRQDVLHLPDDQTEEELDQILLLRATTLGISLDRPETPDTSPPHMLDALDHDDHDDHIDDNNLLTSGTDSAVTIPTTSHHVRTSSTSSHDSASTAPTNHSDVASPPQATNPTNPTSVATINARASASTDPSVSSTTSPLGKRKSKSISFSQYDKYLAQIDPSIAQPKFRAPRPSIDSTHSKIFSPGARRSYKTLKDGIRNRVGWKRRSSQGPEPIITCICCREDFQIDKTHQLRILPCGHTYCATCLHVMITQATTNESNMPPRCCTQPIPGSIVKAILTKEEQQVFLKILQQYSTPWEARIFCPNTACGEFIPPVSRVDPRHPFEAVCRQCKRSVCVMCKRSAHQIGQDCPDDWELDAVLKMGEKSGWRRCYKCRNLVELSVGCTHMTCRCKAQFCYICGAIWDPVVGCPNFCNGEEELDRRRREEEDRLAEEEAEKVAREAAVALELKERVEAAKRTKECVQLNQLWREQEEQMQRFVAYENKVCWEVWLRHTDRKKTLLDKYNDLTEKMKERHAKTAFHLEDRQVAAEMDLRSSLDHQEKSVHIRLKHMEAYCQAEGTSPDNELPPRIVTERDRRELGQQYNVRDDMERLHQARINVLRDQQTKRMEELVERHEGELEKLIEKQEEEVEDLAAEFANETDVIARCLEERKDKLHHRWEMRLEIRRVELEEDLGVRLGPLTPPEWPTITEAVDYIRLPPVKE